jgi:hypothetical protein
MATFRPMTVVWLIVASGAALAAAPADGKGGGRGVAPVAPASSGRGGSTFAPRGGSAPQVHNSSPPVRNSAPAVRNSAPPIRNTAPPVGRAPSAAPRMSPAAAPTPRSSQHVSRETHTLPPATRTAPVTRTQATRSGPERTLPPQGAPSTGSRGHGEPTTTTAPGTSARSSHSFGIPQHRTTDAVAHTPVQRVPTNGSWRAERTQTLLGRDSGLRVRTPGEGMASIPERRTTNGNRVVGAPSTSPRLSSRIDRLPRTLPITHANGRGDLVAPNNGRAALEPVTTTTNVQTAHAAVDVNFFFANPCNRHCTWTGSGGCSFGYVFCNSWLYCYWWRPGCAPCFYPYSYYYWPGSYYYPAYYPTYSEVVVVHDYNDDANHYPPITNRTEPAPEATPAERIAKGWEQFRARDYPGAIDSFRDAVLAAPDDATAKLAYAQALFAIGNYPDAAFLLRRALEMQPDLPVLGEDPRTRYGDPEEHAEQMVALRSFLDQVKGEPAATLVLAWQSYFTGDLGVARESFDALKVLDPEDEAAKRFLARLGPAAPAAK